MLIGPNTQKDFGEVLEQFKAYFPITQTSKSTFLLLLLLLVYFIFMIFLFNLLTPNDGYSGRTAPLTSKGCIFILIQQI